jgi:pimeloyl-ACP methyl ester carboxylesterase
VIAERMRECIPGAERVILPGVTHNGPTLDPTGFSTAIQQFVSKQ